MGAGDDGDGGGGLLTCFVEPRRALANASSQHEGGDQDEFLQFRTRVNLVLTAVSCFGLVGNLMSFVVLFRKLRPRNSFVTLLMALALSDAVFLLSAILGFGLPSINRYYNDYVMLPAVAPVFGFLHTSRTCSVAITLAVNVERFFAIVFPLKHVGWKKYLLRWAVGFSVAFNLPKWFELCAVELPGGGYVMSTRGLRRNRHYNAYYVFWSKLVLVELIPYASILALNCAIVAKTVKAAHFRKKFTDGPAKGDAAKDTTTRTTESIQLTSFRGRGVGKERRERGRGEDGDDDFGGSRKAFYSKQKEEHQLGSVLVAMSVLFIICQAPKLFPDLYELVTCPDLEGRRDCPMDGPMLYVIEVSYLTACLNSALNFVVYSLRGKKYKRAWKETYFCCCRGTDTGNRDGGGGHASRVDSVVKAKTTAAAVTVFAESFPPAGSGNGRKERPSREEEGGGGVDVVLLDAV